MRILPMTADGLDEPALADFTRLTDVALRRLLEPAGGLYLAESTKVIARAIAAGHEPRAVLTRAEWLPVLEPLLAPFPDVPVHVGDDAALESLTGFHLHRGALASMHRPVLPEEIQEEVKLILFILKAPLNVQRGFLFFCSLAFRQFF